MQSRLMLLVTMLLSAALTACGGTTNTGEEMRVEENPVSETETETENSQPAEQLSSTPTPQPTPISTPSRTIDSNTPPPEAELGDTWLREADEMMMVYVPQGSFLMGSDDSDPEAAGDEFPQHEVILDAFWIDRTEVTNAQFAAFVEATGYATTAEEEGNAVVLSGDRFEPVDGADWRHPNGPDSDLAGLEPHPVIQVSWHDASAYCEWAGGRLPTEAEWEYAARGSDSSIFPWSDAFDPSLVNFCDQNCPFDWADTSVDDGYEQTAPVETYPGGASWVGALDMAGNVWEWVNDWYGEAYYESAPRQNPQGPTAGDFKVIRGGGWDHDPRPLRAAGRGDLDPNGRYPTIGFRCAVPAGQ